MKPPKSILDPTFQYKNASQTDIRKTFERIRREQAKAAQPAAPVVPIRKEKKA